MANVTRFTARFSSREGCSSCFADIDEGDSIGYVDDEICCDDCVTAAEDEEQEEIANSGWLK